MNKQSRPIGVFDSGIGGLSVVKSLIEQLPNENIIYFGDIARIPYGTKSIATIQKFTEQTVKFLLKQNVKAIIIACNTISAVAKDTVIQLAGDIPVIDVISAGAKAATNTSKQIGIIATPATINSNAYPSIIKNISPEAKTYSQACALFVPMVEEGFIQHPALELVAAEYLENLMAHDIDSLVLGCTHYPLIKQTIAKILGVNVQIIDPAITACEQLKHALSQDNNLNVSDKQGVYKYFVTDVAVKFQQIGEMFLNRPMTHIEIVNVE